MTRENLVTAVGNVTLEEAERILTAKRVEKLLLVDENRKLTGLITIRDIDMMKRFPRACKDAQGRLRVGAAVGVGDFERAEALVRQGVDLLVVDSAHGHSKNVIDTVREIKQQKSWDIDVVAGNVATPQGAQGADRCRCGCYQSWHWAWFDLHHARDQWRWCAADNGDFESDRGSEGKEHSSHRRRRNPFQR